MTLRFSKYSVPRGYQEAVDSDEPLRTAVSGTRWCPMRQEFQGFPLILPWKTSIEPLRTVTVFPHPWRVYWGFQEYLLCFQECLVFAEALRTAFRYPGRC